MSSKRIYKCKSCVQYFKGRREFDYHMNMHKRTAPPAERIREPKRPKVMHVDSEGML